LPLVDEDISPARLHGRACFHCGDADPPLHPDGVVSTPGVCGVAHDWETVTCTRCLVARRAAATAGRDGGL
jgi:hypothetical protein